MNTHTFKLTSGVECEVEEMTGKHQRILTEQKNKKLGENLNEMLVSVIKRIGSDTHITLEKVKNLLASDRKKILTEVRQFTMDFDPLFKFNYDYVTSQGHKAVEPLEIDLSKGFPSTQLKVLGKNEAGQTALVDATYDEYDNIQRNYTIILPKSKKEVRWTLLDGVGEAAAMATSKADRSSHTAIAIRNPVEFHQGEVDRVPIKLDLDRLPLKDVEALRNHIKEVEGSVDTEIMFVHPEAETKPKEEKEIIVDVLGVVAFFFPSEAI